MLQFLDSSQLVWSRTDNGWDWHDNGDVPRQSSNGVPALVAIKGQLLTVYSSSDKSHDGQLLQTLYILWTRPDLTLMDRRSESRGGRANGHSGD
jgi:hypothetical protein